MTKSVVPFSFQPAKRSLFSDGDQTDNGTTETKKGKWKFDPGHVPYYVVNFEQCVRSVVVETDDRRLFTEQELRLAESFLESRGEEVKSGAISLDAKKIYVRLFQRKLAWLKRSQIAYKEEVVDEDAALNELVDVKLLVDGKIPLVLAFQPDFVRSLVALSLCRKKSDRPGDAAEFAALAHTKSFGKGNESFVVHVTEA